MDNNKNAKINEIAKELLATMYDTDEWEDSVFDDAVSEIAEELKELRRKHISCWHHFRLWDIIENLYDTDQIPYNT